LILGLEGRRDEKLQLWVFNAAIQHMRARKPKKGEWLEVKSGGL
jgi:hypothetical protein